MALPGCPTVRIDHLHIFAPDVEKAVHSYGDMSFRLTEYTRDADSVRLWAACTQQSAAFITSPSPIGLNQGGITWRFGF